MAPLCFSTGRIRFLRSTINEPGGRWATEAIGGTGPPQGTRRLSVLITVSAALL